MAKNEVKIRFSAETGEFNDSIKKANREMSELRAELKLNETQMKTTGATVEGLEQKHRILSNQLQASQDKTEALNQKVNKAIEIYGENSDEVSKLRIQLLNAQTAEEKIKQAIQSCNDELEAQKNVIEEVEDVHESLSDTIKRQQKELDGLKDEYAELVASGKGATDEAKNLARSIEDLSGDLKDNKKTMSDASQMANDLDRSLDNVEESAGNAGDGFTILKGTVADLASSAIQGAIGKLGEFMGYLSDLPSATMELRQDMGTLTTAFDNVGMSTDTAKNTWKELYAVFGEDDRAVETANHIARMADNQKDLNDWVTITTGVFATYQDSLPVEGLAEASAETAKTGAVTGVLADALNWSSEASKMFADYMSDDVVTAEDAFNVALSECTTEQERQALITDTLTKIYGKSADTYRETTGAQMEAKEATAEQILAEANLATAIEPVTTKFSELKTQLMVGVLPAVETVSGALVSAMDWMKEHPTTVQAVATAVGIFAVGLGILATAVGIYTVAQWAMNSAILANPITWIVVGIVAAIALLVAAGVALYQNWDLVKAKASEAWEKIKATWNSLKEGTIAKFNETKEAAINKFNELKTGATNKVNELKTSAVNKCTEIKTSVVGKFNDLKSGAIEKVTSMKTSAISKFNEIKNGISEKINGAKATVQEAIEKIKGFFNFSWSLPKLKMPHFKISGSFSLNPPSVPKLSVDWYKDGGIFTKPTIFNTPYGLKGVGEAGAEAVLPIDRLEGYIAGAIEKTMQVTNIQALADKLEDLANRPVVLNVNGRNFATATANDTDNVNGLRSSFKNRGLVL